MPPRSNTACGRIPTPVLASHRRQPCVHLGTLRDVDSRYCVKDVAMIYAGVFFFFLAIASGLFGFSGMLGTESAHIAQTVFFSSQLLASLSFAWPLVHTSAAVSEVTADGVGDPRTARAGTVAALAP